MPRKYTTNSLLTAATKRYLGSGDFNGLPVGDRMTVAIVTDLIRRGMLSLCRGDRHPNPFVKAYPPEPVSEQLEKIATGGLEGCLYPEPMHLNAVVRRADYDGRPFTLLLALGRAHLEYDAFGLEVLEGYRHDPRYYFHVGDTSGRIALKGDSEQQRSLLERDRTETQFGFAYSESLENRAVAGFIWDLHQLSPEHQRRWETHRLPGKWFLHPDYADEVCGKWPEKHPVCIAIMEEIAQINAMSRLMGREPLFKKDFQGEERPRDFTFLIRPTKREYESFIHTLDKMISENINFTFFGDDVQREREVPRDGKVVIERKGSLQLLAEWLDAELILPDAARKNEMLKVFRDIRKGRQPSAHALGEDVWDPALFKIQRDLIHDVYQALRSLRQIFANHSAVKASHRVPDWLYRGEIRYF